MIEENIESTKELGEENMEGLGTEVNLEVVEEERFSIANWNIGCLIFFSLPVVITLPIIYRDMFLLGEFLGFLSGLIILPSLFSWLAWRLTKNKAWVKNVVFAVALLIAVNNSPVQGLKERNQLLQIGKYAETLALDMAKIKDPAQQKTFYQKRMKSVRGRILELKKNTRNTERRNFYTSLNRNLKKITTVTASWLEVNIQIYKNPLLDFSALKEEEDFIAQKKMIQSYIEVIKKFRQDHATILKDLKEQVKNSPKQVKNRYLKRFAEGFYQGYTRQASTLEPMAKECENLCGYVIQILDLLQDKRGEWYLEDGEIYIDDDGVLNHYNALIGVVQQCEARIMKLATKSVKLPKRPK